MQTPMHLFALAACLAGPAPALADDGPLLPYPEGYRGWHHVKTALVTREHPRFEAIGGFHHIYANDLAWAGYRTGVFADGATIAFDVLDAQVKPGQVVEGSRRWLAVMVKDSARFKATGGWGYDNFASDSRSDHEVPVNGPKGACFACHLQRKEADYVFSRLRE